MNRTIISEADLVQHTDLAKKNRKLSPDTYTDRMIKYIPPDIIAAFTTMEGYVRAPLLSGTFFARE